MENIIQHDGVPCVEAQVHMLPTEMESKFLSKTGALYVTKQGILGIHPAPEFLTHRPQHLYFTIDEEIKEDDWFYNGMNNIVVKATNRYSEMKNPIPHRKIIATTDPKLIAEGVKQILQQFIEEYCKAGGIDKILVEIECLTSTHTSIVDFSKDPMETKALSKPKCVEYALKTDSNNCIIIHPVEEKMYSSTDLIGNQDGGLDHFLLHSAKFSQEEREVIMDAIYLWIKENL